jgi:type I restriction enzyme R subunit
VTKRRAGLASALRRERTLALKIVRHQQFFGIRKAIDRVRQFDANGVRKGGVIWHTQGSGKSLTMVMLGRALALEKAITNPRIIIVTDRDDLDKQIKATFKSCEMEPRRATSGADLIELVRDKAPLITTIVNKFDTALRGSEVGEQDANIFVLVDESHRTQTGRYGGHSQFATKMRRLLPKACYLGFTGTPLLKKDKNTLSTFGGLIHKYTIDEAVADEAVVPLLYEGRLVEQQITGNVIDRWFEKISEGLTDKQKADLKRKFSRMDALGNTGQTIRAKAFDISEHFRQHWQGTGFKAQLVAPSKAAAVRFKEMLDDIGHVTSDIIISPPDDNEGNEEVDKESKDLVRRFWDRMMAKYKTEEEYNRQVIDAFKGSGDPEILIVVSKLLTGFDAPRNTVLYVCKPLREHNLLQAIARVTFYKQFSELLEETIRDYRQKRLSERDYLQHVIDLASKVARKERGGSLPDAVRNSEDGQAFYGLLAGKLVGPAGDIGPGATAVIALAVIEIVKKHHIVGVWSNDVAQNNMRNAIDDYFFDVLRDQMRIELPVEVLDDLEAKVMSVARARFPG